MIDRAALKPKFKKGRLIAALAAVFSAVFLFITYGTTLLSSPFSSVALNGPITADSGSDFTVVADTESRRVLILNDEGNLTGVVNCDTADSPVEAITDVCVSGDSIFIAGVRYVPGSEAIDKERISVYDKGGNLQGTVYERKQESSTEGRRILSINDTAEGVIAAIEVSENAGLPDDLSEKASFISAVNADGEPYEIASSESMSMGIHDAAYSAESGNYVVLSGRGLIDDNGKREARSYGDYAFNAVEIDDKGLIYACDDVSGDLFRFDAEGNPSRLVEGGGFDAVHVNAGRLSLCDRESNRVVVSDLDGNVLLDAEAVTLSIGFSARIVVVWLCFIYLVALALVLAVLKIRSIVKSKRTEVIGPVLASVAVLAVAGVAVGHLSYAQYQTSVNTRAHEVGMCADYLGSIAGSMTESMEKCDSRGNFKQEGERLEAAFGNLVKTVSAPLYLTNAAKDNEIGLYFNLYGKDDKGIFYLMDSADEHVLGASATAATDGSPLDKAFKGEKGDNAVLTGRSLRDATTYRLVAIPGSNGDVAGVIEIGWKSRSFGSLLATGILKRALGLLVMMLAVYLLYTEVRECGRCLFEGRQAVKEHPGDAIALLTRPFTFCITLLTGIDSVMTVLIARDLLTASGAGASSPLLALPAAMLGAGLLIGQLLYGVLGSRVGLRRLIVCGALFIVVCAGFTVASIAMGSFWLYCAAKLVISVPFGMLYTLGYSLPRAAESETARKTGAGGVRRTDTSAAALGTVLGGYAAQLFGNEWVYVLVACACVPVVVMALSYLPHGLPPHEKKVSDAAERRGALRFARSKNAFCIVAFVLFPATMAAGYASFLFPLFSVDLGLSKSEINNIVVMGQLIVFVLISRIDSVEARFGKWRVSTCAVALLGCVFLLFSLNTTIAWSVAVVALVAVLGKSSDGWKAMWLHSADAAGVAPGQATGAMYASRSAVQVAQPFILGSLLNATNSVAVIVIGILCVACAAVFFLSTRRTSLPSMR